MNDNQSDSTDPSAALAPEVRDNGALWSFTGVELIEISPELTLLLDPVAEKRLLVKKEVGICLTHCESYRSLRGHAEYLVATLPQLGGQVEPVIPVLQQICDAGLMRLAESVLNTLVMPINKTPPPPIRVFIITCDRPTAVARLLQSMANSSALELPESYTLKDDSRNPTHKAQNQELVNKHNEISTFQIQYFGMDAREKLLEHLLRAEPELEDSIRFLLNREEWGELPTYGLSRTLALLLGVGKRVLVFDDDVLCEAVRSPLPLAPVQFGSIFGRKAAFWDSEESLAGAKKTLSDCPLALMTRQLGVTLSDGLGTLSHSEMPPTALAKANGAFVQSLSHNSRILQTQCSIWGDPGTSNGHWISELDTESIDRLLAVPGSLLTTVDARASWLGYEGPTLTKHGVMSGLTGYDASHLLPPFLPALRGEDSLFSLMLLTLHPRSLVLSHPWAIPHHPIEERSARTLRAAIPPQGGIALLTRWVGDNVNFAGGLTPEQRLTRMAQGIADLTKISDADVKRVASSELARWQASQVAHFQRQLEHAAQLESRNWQQYLERGFQEAISAVQRPPTWEELLSYPTDEPSKALEKVRRGGHRLAQALEVWPQIWSAAKTFEL